MVGRIWVMGGENTCATEYRRAYPHMLFDDIYSVISFTFFYFLHRFLHGSFLCKIAHENCVVLHRSVYIGLAYVKNEPYRIRIFKNYIGKTYVKMGKMQSRWA